MTYVAWIMMWDWEGRKKHFKWQLMLPSIQGENIALFPKTDEQQLSIESQGSIYTKSDMCVYF